MTVQLPRQQFSLYGLLKLMLLCALATVLLQIFWHHGEVILASFIVLSIPGMLLSIIVYMFVLAVRLKS